MDSLATLRLFVTTVRAGSFSATARQLATTPSSVSRAVSSLEESLGVRLFTRTTRRLTLTEAGELFVDRAERILHDVDEAGEMVRALDAAPRGRLRVTVGYVYGRLHVAPLIPAFAKRYPELNIDLIFTDAVVDLVEDGIDVAIRVGALPDSTLVARRLAPVKRVICASPDYLERHGEPRVPADLATHQCLHFRFHTSGNLWRAGSNVWRLRGPERTEEVSVRGQITANSADVLAHAALEGLGFVLMPTWLIRDHLASGALRTVLDDYEASPTDIETAVYAVYPSGRFLPPKVRAFIDFMAERIERARAA